MTPTRNAPANWRFSGATDFYPDLLYYAVAKSCTGEVAPAMIVSICLLFVSLALAGAFLVGVITDRPERLGYVAAVFGMAALYLLLNARCRFENLTLKQPLMLTYHGGSATCVIGGLGIVLWLVLAERWNWRHWLGLTALYVNSTLCMASDRLIFVQ